MRGKKIYALSGGWKCKKEKIPISRIPIRASVFSQTTGFEKGSLLKKIKKASGKRNIDF